VNVFEGRTMCRYRTIPLNDNVNVRSNLIEQSVKDFRALSTIVSSSISAWLMLVLRVFVCLRIRHKMIDDQWACVTHQSM
jgi:hypothetical protein